MIVIRTNIWFRHREQLQNERILPKESRKANTYGDANDILLSFDSVPSDQTEIHA
jgi:hypothetical protein